MERIEKNWIKKANRNNIIFKKINDWEIYKFGFKIDQFFLLNRLGLDINVEMRVVKKDMQIECEENIQNGIILGVYI